MRLSIVTISFNSVETIERTILSVKDNKMPDVEYIIIDGGSEDGTLDVIKRHLDVVDFYISEVDNGISDAFNKGIEQSKGEFVFLLNSDDILNRDALSKALDYLQPSNDIVCFDMNFITSRRTITVKSNSTRLLEGMYIAHPATIVRRTVYETIGSFDSRFKYSMDYDFLLRAKLNGYNFEDVRHCLTTMHDGGVSNQHQLKAVFECAISFFKHTQRFDKALLFYLSYAGKRVFNIYFKGC